MKPALKTVCEWLLLACLGLLLTACASGQGSHLYPPFYGIALGSQVQLHQSLPIVPGRARVFLQHGVVANNLDQYHPHCSFEVRTLSDGPQSIAPDSFTVTRLQQGFTEVVSLEPMRVAALELAAWYPWDGPLVSRYVHLYLTSQHQPDVLRLTCYGGFDFISDAEWPTPGEIREVLGEVATLENHPPPGVIR